MYFNKFSTIDYKIGNRNYKLLDIFTKISILGDYTSSNSFDQYIIQEGETPDDVAGLVYGDRNLSWLILIANNIYSEDEWYSGDNAFLTLLDKKYGGESYYITNMPDLKEGDVMVKVLTTNGQTVTTIDETKYRIISGFDKTFRSVWGRGGSGTFSANDKIMFGRKNTETGIVEILNFTDSSDTTIQTQYATVKFIEDKKNSPYHLIQYTNNIVVPPNVVFLNGVIQNNYVPANTIFTDEVSTELNFANTLLYYYMTHSGSVPGIQKYSYYTKELNKYKTQQNISIVKLNIVGQVINTIENLLKTKEIGKRVILGI